MTWDNRYRRLNEGEVILEGDECLTDTSLGWEPAGHTVGQRAPDPSYTSHRWYRRLLSFDIGGAVTKIAADVGRMGTREETRTAIMLGRAIHRDADYSIYEYKGEIYVICISDGSVSCGQLCPHHVALRRAESRLTTKASTKDTLKALLKEAEKSQARADKAFRKHDNSDDMREADSWAMVSDWLKEKIEALTAAKGSASSRSTGEA